MNKLSSVGAHPNTNIENGSLFHELWNNIDSVTKHAFTAKGLGLAAISIFVGLLAFGIILHRLNPRAKKMYQCKFSSWLDLVMVGFVVSAILLYGGRVWTDFSVPGRGYGLILAHLMPIAFAIFAHVLVNIKRSSLRMGLTATGLQYGAGAGFFGFCLGVAWLAPLIFMLLFLSGLGAGERSEEQAEDDARYTGYTGNPIYWD